MNHDELSTETVRATGAVLVAIFRTAVARARRVLGHLRPLLEPPEDLRVTGSMGVVYSGVVVIERNVIVAGVVIEVGRVGHGGAPPRAHIPPPSRYEEPGRFEDPRERLPGWADDPRDPFDEDGRWRR
jgi:hypothetical protein